MKHWEHFSGFKPAVEDHHFERDAKELHIKKRIIDLTSSGTGILKDVDNELDVYVHDPNQFLVVKVPTGQAYIQGEKIEIDSEQTVNLDDVETEANIVYLKYKLIDSTDPDAIRQHWLTGQPYVVWKEDSFELIAVKESLYVQTDDKLKLKRVAKISGELKITNDYRTWLTINNDIIPDEVLRKQSAPPIPTHLDLITGWDDDYRKTGESAGLISRRPAYILAEFGDKGQGTASGITFTKTTNRIGAWTVDEWAGYYLTCSDGQSWKVVSNTVDTLTLETGSAPVNGDFWLGPDAAGYKFVIQTLDPETEEIVIEAEAEIQVMESPVKMEFIWNGLTSDIKYRIKVASKGGWFQDEWSDFCTPEDIIAGGPKEIPDACGDVLDGDPTISADDDGIRINWAVKSEYASKVSGFEFCWTDDGTSTPDFDNKNHRKVFTDRNYIVLPAKMSSNDAIVKIKSKMRAVDKAGRHCVTPKTLDDTDAKKYPADVLSYITDLKTSAGDAANLTARLNVALESDGRPKFISEIQSILADASQGYENLGAKIESILAGKIDWQYVRIVAKSGGNYATITAAIESVTTNDPHLILINNDGGQGYDEQITIPSNRIIGLMGLGKDILIGPTQGRINVEDGGFLYLLKGLKITCDGNQTYSELINLRLNSNSYIFINDVAIWAKGTSGTEMDAIKINVPSGDPFVIIMRNDIRIKSNYGNGMNIIGSNPESIKISMKTVEIEIANIAASTKMCILSAVNNTKMWAKRCDFKNVSGASYIIQCTSTAGNNFWPSHCDYNLPADPSNLTIDYGTINGGEVSNVTFNDGDLEIFV